MFAVSLKKVCGLFCVPKAQRRLAGGEGEAATTGTDMPIVRVPAGTPDKQGPRFDFSSCAPAGARHVIDAFPVISLCSITG